MLTRLLADTTLNPELSTWNWVVPANGGVVLLGEAEETSVSLRFMAALQQPYPM
jgi:hypothetical protein